MRTLSNSKLLFIPLLSLLAACDDKEPYTPPRGVIEGTFKSGEFPDVLFSSSISPATEGNLSQAVINWGRVTINDGEREIVLTGRMDSNRLPPFRYYTFDMKGIPGKTYTIRADYNDIHVASTCRMPFPTPIDSITLSPTDVDSLRAATLYFTSPADVPAYYYLTMRGTTRGSVEAPCMLGTLRADKPLSRYSIPILRPKQKLDTVTYIPQLIVGEEWTVSLNRVESEVYDFRVAYDNMLMFNTSPFISTDQSLPTNITGGYGIWSPQGSSESHLSVR